MAGSIKFYNLQVYRDEAEKTFSGVFGLTDKDVTNLTQKIDDRANPESKDPNHLSNEGSFSELLFSLIEDETICGSEIFFLAGIGMKRLFTMAQIERDRKGLEEFMRNPPSPESFLKGLLGSISGEGSDPFLDQILKAFKEDEDENDEDI